MSEPRFDIYLLGETQLSTSLAKLAHNLAAIFKKDISVFEKMLSQPRSLLKANVDIATANKYKLAIDKAGGCCELVSRNAPVFPVAATAPVAPPSTIEIAAVEPIKKPLTIAADNPAWPASNSRAADTSESESLDDEHEPAGRSWVKVIIVAVVAVVIIMGALAVTLLPVYLDKSARTKVQGALPLINETRQKVTAVIQQKNFLPSENLLAGLPENISNEFVSSITLGENAQLTVSFRIPHLARKGKNTIIWTPLKNGNEVVWHCLGGTMSDEYRMRECRGGSQ